MSYICAYSLALFQKVVPLPVDKRPSAVITMPSSRSHLSSHGDCISINCCFITPLRSGSHVSICQCHRDYISNRHLQALLASEMDLHVIHQPKIRLIWKEQRLPRGLNSSWGRSEATKLLRTIFLANNRNKQSFTYLLSDELANSGIAQKYDGDGNYAIMKIVMPTSDQLSAVWVGDDVNPLCSPKLLYQRDMQWYTFSTWAETEWKNFHPVLGTVHTTPLEENAQCGLFQDGCNTTWLQYGA